MRFEYPELLWLLLLVPALTLFLTWAWFKKRRLILQFVQSRLLAHLTTGVSTRLQKLRLTLLVLATATLSIVVARPQWGFDWEETRQRGLDIVVAIDTSKSMLAQDLAPNRLVRAKLAALDLKRLAQSDRVGLVAFAGSAFLQSPLTLDDEAFRQSVEALQVDIIPQGGTALAEAIRTALAAFKQEERNYKVLVLFTDGEDHDGQALQTARQAAEEDLRIFTIGVGTQNGELLRTTDPQGRSEYIKDTQGQVVKSRLNERLLQDIAQQTKGFYLLLTGADTMDLLYERGLSPLPKTEFAARRIQRYHEKYQWFLALALLILITEVLLPERKRAQRTETQGRPPREAPLKQLALLLLLLLPATASGSISEAMNQYRKGNFTAARMEFERALEKSPKDLRLHYNAGAAAYQAHDYDRAQEHLQRALASPELKLQQQAYYNLGNTQYRIGETATEPPAKQDAWQQSVTSYEGALKLDPADVDATHNLALVRQKLKELQEEMQQQQQENQEGSDQDEKDKQNQEDQNKQQEQQQDQQQQQQQQQNESQKQDPKDDSQPNPKDPSDQQQKEQSDASQGQENPQKQPDQEAPRQDGDPSSEPSGNTPAVAVQMTPDQARQLLDSVRTEERPLIFVPKNPDSQRNPNRIFKDW